MITDWAGPVYLGDGLYADFDGYQVRLYASNGVEHTNTVYLEPGVLVSFSRYIEDLKQSIAKANRDAGRS